MKYFSFDGSIEDKGHDLIDFINNNDGDITIFLDSQGGDCHVERMLVSVINGNKDRIHIVASGYLFSCGFTLFFRSKCRRTIDKHSVGMMHLSGQNHRILENGKADCKRDRYLIKQGKKMIKESIDFMEKIGMNKKDIEKVKDGEDVFFNCKQMMKFL